MPDTKLVFGVSFSSCLPSVSLRVSSGTAFGFFGLRTSLRQTWRNSRHWRSFLAESRAEAGAVWWRQLSLEIFILGSWWEEHISKYSWYWDLIKIFRMRENFKCIFRYVSKRSSARGHLQQAVYWGCWCGSHWRSQEAPCRCIAYTSSIVTIYIYIFIYLTSTKCG